MSDISKKRLWTRLGGLAALAIGGPVFLYFLADGVIWYLPLIMVVMGGIALVTGEIN